ncbi:hypothetical protein ACLB90_17785 [Stenotrophomonas sp. LGBM10]|uniref:hypothetical protein n=1 Tax=Stenotrophomonas sp. LGBM10 TaxID=3390038 RepID=UPI00398B6F67
MAESFLAWATRYPILGALLVVGAIVQALIVMACRAVRWCWRCAARALARGFMAEAQKIMARPGGGI